MTPELENILRWQSQRAKNLRRSPLAEAPGVADDIDAEVAAVRQQASQPGKLEKVRELLREWMDYEPLSDSDDGYFKLWERAREMLVELDAVEGKVRT